MRVLEAGSYSRFTNETLQHAVVISAPRRAQHFHRQRFADNGMTARINGPHAAVSEHALDAITPFDDLPDQLFGAQMHRLVQRNEPDPVFLTMRPFVRVFT
jgi:hypothetical protein